MVSNVFPCACNGATLDRLIQPAILVVLADGPLHGYRLTQRIGELPGFSGQKPDVSGVYRFLKAMECKGLVASSWGISESGPAKKSYKITAAGKQCLRCWIKTLENYRRGINGLLVPPARPIVIRQERSTVARSCLTMPVAQASRLCAGEVPQARRLCYGHCQTRPGRATEKVHGHGKDEWRFDPESWRRASRR